MEKQDGTRDARADDMSQRVSNELDHSLASGIAWTAVMRWLAQIVSWAGTLIAARILTPGDYGIVSMAMLAIGLVRMVEDFGLDAVLVQDRSIVGDIQARLAGFIIAVGVAMAAAFVLLSPLIAAFFREPGVAAVVCVLGLLCVTDALQVIPRAALQRDLAFGRLAATHLIQVAVMQSVLVALALYGAGYWAAVINVVAGAAVVTGVLIVWRPYAVQWPRQIGVFARPLLQGWRVIVSRIAWYGYSNADQTIIGRVIGKDGLGAYSFATTFANLPLTEVSSVVTRVVPGVFSEVQSRRDELRRYFLLLTEVIAFMTLPMSAGLALTADQFVPLILGPQWGAVVAPLQILCVYVAFQACQTLISHILMWTGQFRATMWYSVLTAVAMPLGVLFAAGSGLEAVAWTWAVVYPLVNIPALVRGLRTIETSLLDWLRALRPAIVGTVVMAACVAGARVWVLDQHPSIPAMVQWVASIGVGVLVYPVVVWFGFRERCLAIWDLIRQIRRSREARLD